MEYPRSPCQIIDFLKRRVVSSIESVHEARRSFEEVRRRQNSALCQSEFLCKADGSFGTRSNLVENRWYRGGHSFERKVDGFVGIKSTRSAHHQNRRAVMPLLGQSMEIYGADGIQRCCPTGINGSISSRVSRRDGEPIGEMLYSFVAAQPGHEWGRMDVSMGVEIVDCEGSWKCKWGRRSAMHRRRDAAFIS